MSGKKALEKAATGKQTKPSARHVEKEAEAILMRVRDSIRTVIELLPEKIGRSTDLQKTLSIDVKLAWQLFKFAYTGSVLQASVMLPGVLPIQRFLTAVAGRGVEGRACEKIQQAFLEFETFVTKHAGTRSAFHAMVSGGDEGEAVTSAHQKNVFQAASHFLGVQTDYYVLSFLLAPASIGEGERYDLAMVSQKLGLRRLRPDAPVMLAHLEHTGEDENAGGAWFEPIEPLSTEGLVASTIPEFCTDPDVETVQTHKHAKYIEMEMVGDGVGTMSSTDWAFGVVERNTAARLSANKPLHVAGHVIAAVKTLVIDVLLHRSMATDISTRVVTYLSGYAGAEGREQLSRYHRLNVHESVTPLGNSPSAVRFSGSPRYVELIEHVCDRLGWHADEFVVYRCRVDYPVLGTEIKITFQSGS